MTSLENPIRIYRYNANAAVGPDNFPLSTTGNCPAPASPICYFKSYFGIRQMYLPETNTFYIYHPTHHGCPPSGYLYTMSFGSRPLTAQTLPLTNTWMQVNTDNAQATALGITYDMTYGAQVMWVDGSTTPPTPYMILGRLRGCWSYSGPTTLLTVNLNTNRWAAFTITGGPVTFTDNYAIIVFKNWLLLFNYANHLAISPLTASTFANGPTLKWYNNIPSATPYQLPVVNRAAFGYNNPVVSSSGHLCFFFFDNPSDVNTKLVGCHIDFFSQSSTTLPSAINLRYFAFNDYAAWSGITIIKSDSLDFQLAFQTLNNDKFLLRVNGNYYIYDLFAETVSTVSFTKDSVVPKLLGFHMVYNNTVVHASPDDYSKLYAFDIPFDNSNVVMSEAVPGRGTSQAAAAPISSSSQAGGMSSLSRQEPSITFSKVNPLLPIFTVTSFLSIPQFSKPHSVSNGNLNDAQAQNLILGISFESFSIIMFSLVCLLFLLTILLIRRHLKNIRQNKQEKRLNKTESANNLTSPIGRSGTHEFTEMILTTTANSTTHMKQSQTIPTATVTTSYNSQFNTTFTKANTDLPLAIPGYLRIDSSLVLFESDDPIGSGSTARVYKCKISQGFSVQIPENTEFACKRFKGKVSDDEFFQEVSIMADLASHPNISKIYAYCNDDSSANTISRMIVMEYFECQSLGSAMKNVVKFPDSIWTEAFVMRLILNIVEGLEFMHCKSLIHNDLKPDNVLLKRNMKSKEGFIAAITDFSASMPMSAYKSNGVMAFTTVKAKAASIYYLAPEFLEGLITGLRFEASLKYFYARDIYALGASAYELMERRFVLSTMGPDREANVKQIIRGLRPPISEKGRKTYPIVVRVVEKCWEQSYSKRPTASQIRVYISQSKTHLT